MDDPAMCSVSACLEITKLRICIMDDEENMGVANYNGYENEFF